jgi:glucose-6-phosphate dehydrogenase assembly protein OpcA
VSAAPAGGAGRVLEAVPDLRWAARADSIAGIERELARIWAGAELTVPGDGRGERRVAARTSVMNLVVVAPRPETGERAAAILAALTGRHPSRTLVVAPVDPDGPARLDARIQAFCILPRPDAAETCAESIFVLAGGESGRHLAAIVAPLVVHDLPVTLWWPGEPPLETRPTAELLSIADRLVVDGSSWSGDGLARLRSLAGLAAAEGVVVFDLALVRQARWREAIAAVFDRPAIRPFLGSIRRVEADVASPEPGAAGRANVVKPLYHVAWLASRLGWAVERPLAYASTGGTLMATLRAPRRTIDVVIRPLASASPPGTTLRVELEARRRGSVLRAEATAMADAVRVRVELEGDAMLERTYRAPRATDAALLAEVLETGGIDPVAAGTLRLAGALAAGAGAGGAQATGVNFAGADPAR